MKSMAILVGVLAASAGMSRAANVMVDGSWAAGPAANQWTHSSGITFTYGDVPKGMSFPAITSGFGSGGQHFVLAERDIVTVAFPTGVQPSAYLIHDLDDGTSGAGTGPGQEIVRLQGGGIGTTFQNAGGTSYVDNTAATYGSSIAGSPHVELASNLANALDINREIMISHLGSSFAGAPGGGQWFTIDVEYNAVPEPSAALLSLLGLGTFLLKRRR